MIKSENLVIHLKKLVICQQIELYVKKSVILIRREWRASE